MQYPVPQFTDVEDKIIGSLTLKQFGILFGVGIIVFLGYSATKSILVLVFLFVLFGIPGLGLAFANINGRPVYNTIGYFLKFASSPKVLTFHKEAHNLSGQSKIKDADLKSTEEKAQGPEPVHLSAQDNIKQVQELLRKTASEEQDIAGRM